MSATQQAVIPGLVPGIHVGPTLETDLQRRRRRPDVDGRDKPGHDEFFSAPTQVADMICSAFRSAASIASAVAR
jgi:hypothetical protein